MFLIHPRLKEKHIKATTNETKLQQNSAIIKEQELLDGDNLTWMNSGHMKDKSPTIPPSTKASATPKAATIAHIPM